jgi:hypothetical protein
MRWARTQLLATAVAWALATASPVDLDTQDTDTANAAGRRPSCDLSDFGKLVPNLSKQAEVYFQGSSEFGQLSQRWSNLETPIVNVEVLPATENDVVEIVSLTLNLCCPRRCRC